MNRLSRESQSQSIGGGRNGILGSTSLLMQQRRVRAVAREGAGDEGLDLFARNRRSLPAVSAFSEEKSDDKNGSVKLGIISALSAKVPKSGVDDLLSSADMGKHDYDWLLTPPGTPLSSSLDTTHHQLSAVAPTSNSSSRSESTIKASRFSISQTENNQPTNTRPTRSSSATRPSISSQLSNNTSRTSALNTSTASITSYRPSTPTKRANTASTTTSQTTAPLSRPTSSHSSTPVKTRPTLSSPAIKAPSSAADKFRILQGTRPSSPTTRPQVPANLNSTSSSIVARTNSRPSTPTRRAPAPSSNPVSTRPATPTRRAPAPSPAPVSTRPSTPTRRTPAPSTPVSSRPLTPTRRTPAPATTVPARSSSVGRVPATNSRNPGPHARPSSPSSKVRPPTQPIVPSDISTDAPPNLRTKLPQRPSSAGRTRPGSALTVRTNLSSEAPKMTNPTRRQSSSPTVTRGRLPEYPFKNQMRSNGHETTPPESQKAISSDGASRKPAKPATATESTGFGRTISKRSLDMALKHMDIKQSLEGIRGASLFPQSIRSSVKKGRPACNGTDTEEDNDCRSISGSYSGAISENGDSITVSSPDRDFLIKRATQADVYESSRYDAILLKEDHKNMNWLHSIEDKSDESPVFDHRFEPLPEPFALP